MTTCTHLAEHFTEKVLQKYFESDELHLVFERYDFPLYLKSATWVRRQGDQHPVYYRVTDHSHRQGTHETFALSRKNQDGIDGVSICQGDPKIRMHGKECYCGLVVLLSRNSLLPPEKQPRRGRHQDHSPRCWCCFWWCDWNYHSFTRCFLPCPQEDIHSFAAMSALLLELDRDTEWLIWNLGYTPESCSVTWPSCSKWCRHCRQLCWKRRGHLVEDLYESWWRENQRPSKPCYKKPDITWYLSILTGIKKLVCQVYVPNNIIDNVKELRWWLFWKKEAQSKNLPLTPKALRQAINRANYLALVWNLDTVPEPQLLSPETFGWKLEDDKWVPVKTSLPPAPEAIIQLV